MGIIYNEYERLGGPYEGSYATVYKVRHVKYGYVRALKVLKDSIEDESDKKYQTFVKECRMLLKIGNGCHPHIVRVFHPCLINNQAMVEMDYINGIDLDEYLARKKFMTIDEIYKFIHQIGGALAYCHHDIYLDQLDWDKDDLDCDPNDGSQPLINEDKRRKLIKEYRIIHNDLHSKNVMRRRYDGNFFLLDFGLAIQNGEAVKSSSLRQGAPEYKSPEKWNGADVETPQNDIYSFGVLLYEVLTGLPPFPLDKDVYNSHPEKAIVDVEDRHLHEKPAPIEPKRKAAFQSANPGKAWQRDYPAWLEQMVMKCLAKNPGDRYADAKELIEDFNRHLSEDEAASKRPKQEGTTRRQQQYVHKLKKTDVDSLLLSGHKYWNAKSYGEAIKHYRLAAELGCAEAQNLMGRCYSEGWGVPRDPAIAFEWYGAAANQGNASGQYNLGYCYCNGEGVDQNYSEAVNWFRKAAAQGDSSAQYSLGVCYLDGKGVDKNYSEAAEWLRKAADQGHVNAQRDLNRLNKTKKWQPTYPQRTLPKQPQDSVAHTKAIKYSVFAAVAIVIISYLAFNSDGGALASFWMSETHVADSLFQVGRYYYKGEFGYPQDTSKAVKCFKQAAKQGHITAQNWLGDCYYKGEGVEKDSSVALEWYSKAAAQGDSFGQYNVGMCYYNKKDYNEAVKWFLKAAAQGNACAQNTLGDCYYYGNGEDGNYIEAVNWYRKSADQNFAWAQYNLGVCYQNGNGVPRNISEAVKWYNKAADQGNKLAQYNLGFSYEYGEGVAKDRNEAIQWYRKAAAQGHSGAKAALKRLGQDVP